MRDRRRGDYPRLSRAGSPGYLARMPEIRILADRVANQIAAGEVVERPAAVVKELLENALDAGATRVTVEFRNGGKAFIAIEDNGCGMTPEQAILSLERHATSKIRDAADLDTIGTFGFRGEALPSVASVSEFSLKTRVAEAVSGTEILVNAGRLTRQREVGMAPGTRIEVRHLFHPVPARLKFLKSDNTEAAHITRLVRLYAVAHPEIGFTLWEDGREIFRSPPEGDLTGRVRGIWGRQTADDLFVMPEGRAEGMRVRGLIGKPGVGRPTRQDMVTIINGRPVDSRVMAYALTESYHTFIPKGRYPHAFLFLDMDPSLVDVNVHPAKREVRFRDEPGVRRLLIESVLKALQPEESAAPAPVVVAPEEDVVPRPQTVRAADAIEPVRPAARIAAPVAAKSPVAAAATVPLKDVAPAPATEAAPAPRVEWRPAGRLPGSLALFATDAGLVVLDLRAAHERIVYERVMRRFAEKRAVSQQLLLPPALEFEPLAGAALKDRLNFFAEAGFELEEFGRHLFRLNAVPDWLNESEAERFVRDLVAALARRDGDWRTDTLAHDALAKLAASRALRADDRVSDEEIRGMLKELFACRQPAVCPKGRRVFFELPKAEIDRRLGR